jgi:hypothetical protein
MYPMADFSSNTPRKPERGSSGYSYVFAGCLKRSNNFHCVLAVRMRLTLQTQVTLCQLEDELKHVAHDKTLAVFFANSRCDKNGKRKAVS